MLNLRGEETKPYPPFIYRVVRYFVWLVLRNLWILSRRLGLQLPLKFFVRHPLDAKVARQLVGQREGGSLLAICDFAAFPLSYDVAVFLAVAERKRIGLGCRWLDVAIIIHHDDPIQDNTPDTNPVQQGHAKSVAYNLAVDMTRLLKSQGSVLVFHDRTEFEIFLRSAALNHPVFPEGYDINRPNYASKKRMPPLYGFRHFFGENASVDELPFEAPALYQQLARDLIAKSSPKKPFITITLRETPHQPERNSSLEDWQRLIDHFEGKNINFAVLRDFYALENPPVLSGKNVFEVPEAVVSLPLRVALYQEATLNLFVNGGPATICVLTQGAKYLVFNVGNSENGKDVEQLRFQHGLNPGESPIPDMPACRYVWHSDTFATLRDEVEATLKSLEIILKA